MATFPVGRYFGFLVDQCQATQVPSLGEIKIYDQTGAEIVPVAAYADNTQGGYPTSNMIDGNVNTFWLSSNGSGAPRAVVWIDLGASYTISEYRLWNRQDYYGKNESWRDFRVFVTDTPPVAPWTDAIANVKDEYKGIEWNEADNKSFAFSNGPSSVRANQLAFTVITAEGAEGIEIDNLVIVAVQLEIDYLPMLVPISLPGYTFSGKGYYIQK